MKNGQKIQPSIAIYISNFEDEGDLLQSVKKYYVVFVFIIGAPIKY